MNTGLQDFINKYMRRHRKIILICVMLLIVLAFISVISVSTSQYGMSFSETYRMIIDHINGATYDRDTEYELWFKDYVAWNQCLPRMLAGILVGATLAIGGTMMQSTIKNPLADPYTTGISSGALFGVTLFLVLDIDLPLELPYNLSMVIMAFIFSLIPVTLIALVTVFNKKVLTPTAMILVGIGTMYLFSAASSLIRFNANPNSAQAVYEWSLGAIGKISWESMPLIIGAFVLLLAFSVIYHRTADIVSEGDPVAISLGVNPKRFRILCLLVISLATATIVCFTGTIGFVGLVCPHVARAFVGASNKHLVVASAITGSLMLVICDCISKVVITSGLPVGVITSLIGSPIFVLILLKQHRSSSW